MNCKEFIEKISQLDRSAGVLDACHIKVQTIFKYMTDEVCFTDAASSDDGDHFSAGGMIRLL
jgi:hypothetical protein